MRVRKISRNNKKVKHSWQPQATNNIFYYARWNYMVNYYQYNTKGFWSINKSHTFLSHFCSFQIYHSKVSAETGFLLSFSSMTLPPRMRITLLAISQKAVLWVIITTVLPWLAEALCSTFKTPLPVL